MRRTLAMLVLGVPVLGSLSSPASAAEFDSVPHLVKDINPTALGTSKAR